MPQPPVTPARSLPWPAVAAAAWLVPGLGHWLIGHRARGVILAVTILGVFTCGLLIGGIDVIDYRSAGDREDGRARLWWFAIGQVHTGAPALAVAAIRHSMDTRADAAPFGSPDAVPPYQPSVGRVHELGTLYCALAGGLNLLCVLDVIGRVTRSEDEDDAARPSPRAEEAAS